MEEDEEEEERLLCSTSAYMAPELLSCCREEEEDDDQGVGGGGKGGVSSIASLDRADVWSLGVTLFAMTTGHTPWSEATGQESGVRDVLKNQGGRVRLSPKLVDLLDGMLTFQPDDRLGLDAVAAHAWMTDQAERLGLRIGEQPASGKDDGPPGGACGSQLSG